MAEEAISVFLSYSHHDAEMLTELNKHLAGLRRTKKIKTWHDRDIEAGDEWEPAIQQQLNTADIIILLISADFIASDYCYDNELQRAVERHDAGEACVIPVILKPCLWDDSDIPFSKLNVLPNRALAITQWKDLAEAYTNVAKGISSAVTNLRNKKLGNLEAVDSASDSSKNQPSVSTQSNEILIDQVREYSRQKILERHSRMRLLSGAEIGVDQLYVDVWLLGKPERRHFNTAESLLSNFDVEQDRLALSKRIQRNLGFDIANRNSKLVILGKPGSGKTTFLKHLATDWGKGKFQPKHVSVLIELRRIRDQSWSLVDAIGQELELSRKEILVLLKGNYSG